MGQERKTFKSSGGIVWREETPSCYAATIAGVRLEIHGEYGISEPTPFTVCNVVDGHPEWMMRGRHRRMGYSSRIGAANAIVRHRKRERETA